MNGSGKIYQQINLGVRNHVEEPLLDQLSVLGWESHDLDNKQHPSDTFRANFTEALIPPVLCEQLIKINPWLEEDQVEEVVTRPPKVNERPA